MQDRFALRAIELDRLLLVQFVDIGIAAVGERAAFDELGLDAGRRIAKSARSGLDDVFELLLVVFLDEGGALDGTQPGADPDRRQIVDDRLADIRVRGVAVVIAGIEAAGVTGLGEQLFRLLRIVGGGLRRRLPEKFVAVGDDGVAGHLGIAEGQRVIRALAVDREARGASHPLVMPG